VLSHTEEIAHLLNDSNVMWSGEPIWIGNQDIWWVNVYVVCLALMWTQMLPVLLGLFFGLLGTSGQ